MCPLLAANICLSSGPETRTHTTYTACKQHFCIFLCVWFLHSSFCLCRVVLLPSVCAMASDVSKSGALKQSWRASAFASLQEFLAKFAPEIVQLQKKDLRSVANSSQSKKHAEWKQAQSGSKPWNYRLCSYAVILAFSNFAWQAEVSILQLYRNRIRTRSRSLLFFTCVSLLTASVPAKWLRWCLRCFLF